MDRLLLGKKILGNFRSNIDFTDISNAKLEKVDDKLYMIVDGLRGELRPIDRQSEIVVDLFDSFPVESCASIYRIELNKDVICVILYTYKETIRLTEADKKMFIYANNQLENELLSSEKFEALKLKYKKDIPAFLEKEFMYNNSIFVVETKKSDDEYTMYGRNYYARIRNERTGVFSILRIVEYWNRNILLDLNYSQIYGQVKFITFEESISISSDRLVENKRTQTSEVIKAWDQYMDFERALFNEQMDASHIFHYINFKVVGNKIVFKIDKKDLSFLDDAKNGVYEMLPCLDNFKDCFPNTTEEIREFKKDRLNRWAIIYLGSCINEDFDSDSLIFDYDPKILDDWNRFGGIIYLSSLSLDIEQKRRKKVKFDIDSKKNVTANIIMGLADPDVKDYKAGRTHKAVTNSTMNKMFGEIINLKENYREAMEIAINTPDIALIQGPPGAGKTTLIRGIVARLNEIEPNCKIMISAEQHEALYNAITESSKNNLIPPYITSRRHKYDEKSDEDDEEQINKNVKKFQDGFLKLCDEILKEDNVLLGNTSYISKLVYYFTNIKNSNYSINELRTNFESISSLLSELGFLSEVTEEYTAVNSYIFRESNNIVLDEEDIETKLLKRKISSQRLSLEQFLDDGEYQLEQLQNRLSNTYNSLLMPQDLFNELMSGDEMRIQKALPNYLNYVENVKKYLSPDNIVGAIDVERINVKELVDRLYFKIMEVSKHHKKSFYDIVEDLRFRLTDIDNAKDIVKNYTNVIGSTCAQAQKSLDYVTTIHSKFDYVIIDEAARANPLDIMIPMMMGSQVILIGDQNQLPHYIETTYLKKFESKNKKFANYDKNLLTKSFFEILYDNLQKAYDEGRLKFKRTIRIDEQHRMHPTIGNFISNEFYEGTVENGARTINHINDYNVYKEKNLAWINVPLEKGPEQKQGASKLRYCEADKVIEIISKLIKNNPNKKLDIGIISFYGGQIDLINEKVKEKFADDYFKIDSDSNVSIACDTVDSFQGKQFDIVILSCVRANSESEAEKALGFIQYSNSRINVALSRAKRLLIVVGDKETFGKNKHFNNFIEYVKKEGYYE